MPIDDLQKKGEEKQEEEICVFAQTNYRNQMVKFGIKTDDRRRHMYVIGKTGMGKTTMMENMVLSDIYSGQGVGIVDPHGDFAEKIINYIPPHRTNDVVYLNPSDVSNPIGFNVFEVESEEQKHLVASGLMGIFQKIWPDVWSSRMEYILNNTILALLDYPGSTLLGINRLLADAKYRRKVVKQLTDPVIKAFWRDEFANYEPRYAKEAVAPIQNKIGQFLSASVIRNMVAQVKSTINIREIMDTKKIFIMNLSKGRIGEDNSRLLGGMLITKLQLAAMERVDIPEEERKDFFLYVDEFQNFATPSFANILSEARKYRLSLIMAHQYVAQLDEVVADAVFGNVGTITTFRIGGADAEMLAKEFAPTFIEEDIVNLAKFHIMLKLMIDGVASQPFTALTMAPIGKVTGSAEKVIRVSRERYSKKREVIEDKILRWSGMEADTEGSGEEGREEKFEGNERSKKKKKNKDNPVKKQDDTNNSEDITNKNKAEEVNIKKEPEETVSLSALLPKEDEVKLIDQDKNENKNKDVTEDVMFDQDISSNQDNKKEKFKNKDNTNPSSPSRRSSSSDQLGRTSDESTRIDNNKDGEQKGDKPKKKKRKRKRKKKKKDNTIDGQNNTSPSPPSEQNLSGNQPGRTSDKSTRMNRNQKEKKDNEPKKIDPDEVVKFDQDISRKKHDFDDNDIPNMER